MTDGGFTRQELLAMHLAASRQPGMLRLDEDWENDFIGLSGAEDLVVEHEQHHQDLVQAASLRAITDGWGTAVMWITRSEGHGDFS